MEILLYAILLENNKVILHPTVKEYKKNLFTELELCYEFVNISKPIKILSTYYIFDVLEIDKYVKEYMLKYGIDNVRGGSYIEIILPDYKIKSLENELSLNMNKFSKKALMINNIIEKYNDMDIEDRKIEKNILFNKLDEFNQLKKDYSYYGTLISSPAIVRIDRNIINNLDWLHNHILYNDINDFVITKDAKFIYNETILLLKKLAKLFFERFPDYDFKPTLYYQRPDVIFDRIFIHKRYFNDWEQTIRTAVEVYNKFEFMYYKLLNCIEELEFDLSTFSEDFEEEAQLTIKHLDSL
jgi:hypothetical protein